MAPTRVGAAATREEAEPEERSGGLPFLVGGAPCILWCRSSMSMEMAAGAVVVAEVDPAGAVMRSSRGGCDEPKRHVIIQN